MSVFRSSTMLLKNNELYLSLHDVDEKAGDSRDIRSAMADIGANSQFTIPGFH